MDSVGNKPPHQAIREWIERILQLKGWNPTRLAREAGVSSSTISRALNDDRFVLTTRTIDKIKKVLSVNEERELEGRGHREGTHFQIEFISTGGIVELVQHEQSEINQLLSGSENIKFYRYNEKDLELLGVIPGDILIVDESELGSRCRKGDIALVAIKAMDGVISTVFRYFHPPYLLTKHLYARRDNQPMLPDGETFRIIGRAIGLVRQFPSS